MPKLTLPSVGSGVSSATQINANFSLITAFLDTVLSLDGTTPNQMTADFDLNSNDILNGKDADFSGNVTVSGTLDAASITGSFTVAWGSITGTLADQTDLNAALALKLETVQDGDIDSEVSTNGQVLTSNGAGGATWQNAAGGGVWGLIAGTLSNQTDLQTELDNKLDDLDPVASGSLTIDSTDPALLIVDNDGAAASQELDLVWTANTETFDLDVYNSSFVFQKNLLKVTNTAVTRQGNALLENVVEDTTPQLGGSLDVNGQKIVSVSNGNIDIEPNGTGDVLLGNFTFDADQTVGAGQDNYVLTYDSSADKISLEEATGGAGTLAGLTDTDVNSPATDEFLTYATVGYADVCLATGSGPVGYWRLNEASSASPADDQTSTNNNGSYLNGPTMSQSTPITGGAGILLDGVNEAVNIPDNNAYDNTATLTINIWAKFVDATIVDNLAMFTKDSIGATRAWTMFMNSSGNLRFYVDAGVDISSYTSTSTIPTPDSWHMYTVTFSSGTAQMYLDGAAIGTTTNSSDATSIPATTDAVRIGATASGAQYADASFTEAAIWDEALTAQQISDLYDAATSTSAWVNQPFQLPSSTVAGLPSASPAGKMVFVSDETGGAVPCFSDGTNWRRVTDRVVAS